MWRCPILGAAVLLSAVPTSECASPHAIILKPHSNDYTEPTDMVANPIDSTHLFVVERGGLIKIVPTVGGPALSEPFLDVTDNLGVCDSGYCQETGLLGLAFHPNYVSNGKFYLDYTQFHPTETFEGGATWCSEKVLTTIISEFTVDPGDPFRAIPESERKILTFNQPYCNHNGGGLAFGPKDGYLYIGSGDGGSGGDPEEYGQNTLTMLGKLLRIDVDNTSDQKRYAIPGDNPFINDENFLDEIWAYGLRNPWRISFDTKTANLHIADVGQNAWEEVNFQSVNSAGGQNYGWNIAEGRHCFKDECNVEDPKLTWPILEYSHDEGDCSITGGHVHRNKDKNLKGKYFYGDYCSGKIWSAKKKKGKIEVELMHSDTGYRITSFGRDNFGDLYVIDLNGKMAKIQSCKDVKKFKRTFKNEEVTCKKISDMSDKKIARYCKKNIVKKKCIHTCDAC